MSKWSEIKYLLKRAMNVRTGIVIMIIIIIILGCIGSVSYAMFTASAERKGALNIVTGNLYSLIESSEFNSDKQVTVDAGATKLFNIKITNVNSIDAKFNLYYSASTTINDALVTIGYTSDKDSAPDSNGYVISKNSSSDNSKTVEVKIINNTASSITFTFGSDSGLTNDTLTFPSGKSVLELVSPNAPELIGDMIPVVYDSTNSTWVKTDSQDGSWYDYDKQQWANAVTIEDTTKRATYKNSEVGTAISMDDINTMWVWIPRYSYTIRNTYGVQGYGGSTPAQATPGAINIKWVPTTKTDTGSAVYTGDTASEFYTPNGFCWGDTCDTTRTDTTNKEIAGIWVGKFETSPDQSSICATSNSVANCNVTTIKPIVKPDIQSWRNQQVANEFTTSRNIQDNWSSSYGFSGNYDSHVIKNTEWGAVAYLSQSKYGKYGNTDYSGALKEIYKNDSSSFYTGRSQGTAPATSANSANGTYTYTTTGGQGASTTGNITGIYDMSGGAWDYVMGNYNNYSGRSSLNNSGFSGLNYDGTTTSGISFPSERYYNLYTTSSSATACSGGICYGHALSDTANWYGDYAYFVSSSYNWFVRGDYWSNNSNAGIFVSRDGTGGADGTVSSRITLINN